MRGGRELVCRTRLGVSDGSPWSECRHGWEGVTGSGEDGTGGKAGEWLLLLLWM